MVSDNNKINENMKNKPINFKEIIDSLLREKRIENKYIKPYIKEIILKSEIPEFRFNLKDLKEKLLLLFRNNINIFFVHFQDCLFDRLKFETEINEIIEKNNIEPKMLHIIPISNGLDSLIPIIKDLNFNLTNYKLKLTWFHCRFMNIGIDKSIGFNFIEFNCPACLTKIKKYYPNNIDKKIKKPDCCMNPRCKNNDFEIVGEDSFEKGLFLVEDLDIKKRNHLTCYILKNINYFVEKTKNINLNEEVEILGILRINYSDLVTRKESQKFEYYLDVIDINPLRIRTFDDAILKTLEEKLKGDVTYFERLIDSIHPLTYLIDIYHPIKLIELMSFITGGSWNQDSNIRDSINSIIAGPKNTYKSSISRNLETIIGKRQFLLYEVNKEMTKAGLIGTTQRTTDNKNPLIRYGLLPLYSNGTIVFDEGQKIENTILDTFRCLEKGNAGGVQDGIFFEGETKGSIILSQNCVINKDGSFKPEESLFKNLGWEDKNGESRLERFDLFYIIPIPDTFVKTRELDNEKRLSTRNLFNEIAENLEISDYVFPKEIDSIEKKLEYVLFHYFHRAKELYKKIQLSEGVKDEVRKLYRNLLDSDNEIKNNINMRSLNICFKVIKALAGIRFEKEIDSSVFNYFQQKCLKLIIPFRDSELINTKAINIDVVFQKTIENLIQLNTNSFSLKEVLLEMSQYIKRQYYNDKPSETFEKEVSDFVGKGYTSDNYKMKKLLKNNENWLKKKGFIIESKKGKGNITEIKRNDELIVKCEKGEKVDIDSLLSGQPRSEINNKIASIMDRLKELFEENNWKPIEKRNIIQILEVDNINKEFVKNNLEKLIEEGTLYEPKPGYIKFTNKED